MEKNEENVWVTVIDFILSLEWIENAFVSLKQKMLRRVCFSQEPGYWKIVRETQKVGQFKSSCCSRGYTELFTAWFPRSYSKLASALPARSPGYDVGSNISVDTDMFKVDDL